ncbi:hypothetical protein BRC64_12630 [Halobacteriales archaeon QH_10_67_22]|nr:MAG: hypothetical protein BRC64_12630 [Halobacteriales archaeon QH_10_67_22]
MDSGGDHLETQLAAYLGGNEDVKWRLTNAQSGVVRESGGTETATQPGRGYGAVAAITNRRTLFVVGGGADDGSDDVASIPHFEVAGIDYDADPLASRLVLTTAAGSTWRFTVREPDALSEVLAYVRDRMRGAEHVTAALSTAREYREGATRADDLAVQARRYDEAVDAYRRAVDLCTAPPVSADVDTTTVREEVVDVVAEAIDAHLERAREARSRGNWEFQAGDERAASDHLSTALDAFERAVELARQCPPGDADAIADERAALVSKLEDLEVRASVAAAGED